MDLYDDLDTKQRAGQVDGWSSGIKLLQTQLALKKNTPIPPKSGMAKRSSILTPVIAFKTRKDNDIDDIFKGSTMINNNSIKTSSSLINPITQILPPPTQLTLPIQSPLSVQASSTSSKAFNDYDWDVIDEYDPLWPNEYDKLVKEKREKDEKPRDRNNRNDDRKRRGTRFQDDQSPPSKYSASSSSSASSTATTPSSGFCARPASMDDDEDSYSRSSSPSQSAGASTSGGSSSTNRVSGAAIAPPPSLQDNSQSYTLINDAKVPTNISVPYGSSSVAAKIMAKYGFKDGQGLGKQEQGMSIALQVEKTSKRGGRIIHEKELMPAPSLSPPLSTQSQQPQQLPQQPNSPGSTSQQMKNEPTITEIMKAPSKVVLLRNMVGPGDVDSELEPEVKDECNTKYGEVVSVIINELTNVPAEEAVRIFVEFKRIESAIKAVVDLNGRFFGGRQVKAGFFSFDRYKMYDLTDN